MPSPNLRGAGPKKTWAPYTVSIPLTWAIEKVEDSSARFRVKALAQVKTR